MAQLSPVRRRMIEDMTVRNMSPATQRSYVRAPRRGSTAWTAGPCVTGFIASTRWVRGASIDNWTEGPKPRLSAEQLELCGKLGDGVRKAA